MAVDPNAPFNKGRPDVHRSRLAATSVELLAFPAHVLELASRPRSKELERTGRNSPLKEVPPARSFRCWSDLVTGFDTEVAIA